ncbi:hypothetical protein [Acidiferrobacter thiooxydans]|uniref:Uncharacterized protein n=1 Tax=Acidiferrobacter thiooxydans TaxID=163359 RepID=A0A368HEH8_9GAMM|nr:hypothetical protein [Acidiferrobacter thiooxydans]RCN56833.1 hypothetical protein C4900_13850 [Acidiferrobacter thiooxydans]
MNTALGWGLAALVGVTALSIDMSIIIPAHDARAARAETGAAWALARAALTHAGRSCQNTVAQSGGLTARPVAQGGRCVVHVTIPADPGVPAVVRGVRLAAVAEGVAILCEAQGGHGAGAQDFPAACSYRPSGMLL